MRILTTLFLLSTFIFSQAQESQLQTFEDSVSYAIGLSISKSLDKQGIEGISPEILASALRDAKDSVNTWTPDQAEAWLNLAMKKIMDAKNEATKQEGLAWLEENAKRKGVQVTESGLQYEVIKAGTGNTPTTSDRVTVHYTGTLLDGTKFDSSVDKGRPSTFGVTQVIKGWTEGLQLMKEGAVYKFYIPYDLAYGCGPSPGGKIPFCSSLVFQVELIAIE